ncbi:butyrophilin subfamily 2 member A2-like [Protopterus annectens]|uniref:butyrophilin subfamily 2 member A2-like n=1 Tax=Protopterus annectens TaxID=7888 RepID=UPI001CF948D1|nr:butyrophilin subfamily 2 member A2-like [Protopterus annectens]
MEHISALLRPTVIIFILNISDALAGSFSLSTLNPTVVASLGENAVLSCYITPLDHLQDLQLIWEKTDMEIPAVIYAYHPKHKQKKRQDEDYTSRTMLFKDDFSRGNVSLIMRRVQRSDEGAYTCTISNSVGQETVSIYLTVADEFNPRMPPWLIAFTTLVMVLMVLIFVAIFAIQGLVKVNVKNSTESANATFSKLPASANGESLQDTKRVVQSTDQKYIIVDRLEPSPDIPLTFQELASSYCLGY